MDPVKVARVCEWPVSENWTDMQAFLGFANFYHQFICNFLGIACPLFDLTCSSSPWTWKAPQQEAFDALKTMVTSASVLASPQDSELFRIEADSSDFATGAILLQQSPEDGKWHPVAFLSKSLSSVEQ